MSHELNDQPRIGEPMLSLGYRRMGSEGAGLAPGTVVESEQLSFVLQQLAKLQHGYTSLQESSTSLEQLNQRLTTQVAELAEAHQQALTNATTQAEAEYVIQASLVDVQSRFDVLQNRFIELSQSHQRLAETLAENQTRNSILEVTIATIETSFIESSVLTRQAIIYATNRLVVALDQQTVALVLIGEQLTLANAPKPKRPWWRFWQ